MTSEKAYTYELIFDEFKLPSLKKVKSVALESLTLDTAKSIVEAIEKAFGASRLAEEHIWIACLSAPCKVIALFDVSHGTTTGALLNTKGIMQRALISGAASIVMVHNHPSGNVSPSNEDVKSARQLRKAADMFDISLLDSIIISSNNASTEFFSMHETPYYWDLVKEDEE